MGKTSTAVKQRYLDKAYIQWNIRLKPDDYEMIEDARGEMSRAEFLVTLTKQYIENQNKKGA